MKYIGTWTTNYTLEPCIYEFSDITLMLKFLLPDNVKKILLSMILDQNRIQPLIKRLTLQKYLFLYSIRFYTISCKSSKLTANGSFS